MNNQLLVEIVRIGLAAILGLIVGWEREREDKPAGVRDVALVTVGSALFTIIALEIAQLSAQFSGVVKYDVGRIIAYTIVSMGFLGSGVIIQRKKDIEGLTTAAVLWTMVGIGILCGIGNYVLATVSTGIIYLLLKFKHVTIKFEEKAKNGEKKC